MKKLVSLVLALVLALAMSVTAFAGEAKTETVDNSAFGSNTHATSTNTVDVIIATGATIDRVYSVDIKWESLEFTYDFTTSNPTWDPETHDYKEEEGTTGWESDESSIQVTNHSNAAVEVSARFNNQTNEVTTSGVTATITSDQSFTGILATAEDTPVIEAPNTLFGVKVKGVPEKTENFTVGTITVTISK